MSPIVVYDAQIIHCRYVPLLNCGFVQFDSTWSIYRYAVLACVEGVGKIECRGKVALMCLAFELVKFGRGGGHRGAIRNAHG